MRLIIGVHWLLNHVDMGNADIVETNDTCILRL
jgi:hypothetical protein